MLPRLPGGIGRWNRRLRYIEASVVSGSAVALTTSTDKTVCSIPLPVGDWDVSAICAFTNGATTNFTVVSTSLSTVDNTGSSTIGRWAQHIGSVTPGGIPISIPTPVARFLVTSPTTVYLIAYATFTVSTAGGYGLLRAREAIR